MSWIDSLLGGLNKTANSINPMKGATDWMTNNTLAKLPVVGKPLGKLANWGDSHPAQVGAAIGAVFGGEALLGSEAGAGGASVEGGMAGGGAESGGLGSMLGGGDGIGTMLGGGGDELGSMGDMSTSSSGFDWQSQLKSMLNSKSSGSSSGSGSGSSAASQSDSPDYFSSLFTFGPGSVSSQQQTTQPTDYAGMLLDGLE